MNVLDFKKRKTAGQRITMVTCYDAWSARIIDRSETDCVLVGDSAAMVVHGYPSTVHATPEMMTTHIAAVARGLAAGAAARYGAEAPEKPRGPKFLVGDMPFLSYRKGTLAALECVESFMRAGAHAVKLEGVWGHEDVVRTIVQSGVPVMGHIGLTPQSIHQLGGFRVQGRGKEAQDLLDQARRLEELGCFSLVLECVPAALAAEITAELGIPTIGIGAGAGTDGQVLVLQDLLGMSSGFKPKFLKQYLEGEREVVEALNAYHQEVVESLFPTEKESYT